MNEMDKSTAEIIERITTEREELRYKLEQRIQYILLLEQKLNEANIKLAEQEMKNEELKEWLEDKDTEISCLKANINAPKEENRQR